MTLATWLAREVDDTRDWTLRLLADMDGDDWVFSPGPGLPHALWLCGHMAVAQHLLVHVRCLDSGVLKEDVLKHFPIGGDVKSPTEYDYPLAARIRKIMDEVHAETVSAIKGMSETLLAEPAFGLNGAPHPHYTDKAGAVAHCSRHEAFHAGQLATIRRLLGKPFLR